MLCDAVLLSPRKAPAASAIGIGYAGYWREAARGLEPEAFLRFTRFDRAFQRVADVGAERDLRCRLERRIDDVAGIADDVDVRRDLERPDFLAIDREGGVDRAEMHRERAVV